MSSKSMDYEWWTKQDLWRVHAAISLILGQEPKEDDDVWEYAISSGSQFSKNKQMFEASVAKNEDLIIYEKNKKDFLLHWVKPSVFLSWVQKKNLEIPNDLVGLIGGCEEDIPQMEEKKRPNQMDKLICQAIARTLWDIYPHMTIEDMRKHHAIQTYGNGKHYQGKNTLRDWLSEVDPRSTNEKTGRPPSKK